MAYMAVGELRPGRNKMFSPIQRPRVCFPYRSSPEGPCGHRNCMGRAGAPPRGSPEEPCDGGPRKGPPDRAIGLPDVARLYARKAGSSLVEGPARRRKSGRVGVCLTPRGALQERHTTELRVVLRRPAPLLNRGGAVRTISPSPQGRRDDAARPLCRCSGARAKPRSESAPSPERAADVRHDARPLR